MIGILRALENSKHNLREVISKTKDEKLKKECEKKLKEYENMTGGSYY